MLDRKSRQVLHAISKANNGSDTIHGSELLLPYLPKKYTVEMVDRVLWHLQDECYVECTGADDTVCYVFVKYEGQNYKEFNWLKFKEALLKSILLPIGISALTSIITIVLTNLLSEK